MFKNIRSSYPKDKFDTFHVYITNGETAEQVAALPTVGTMWSLAQGNELRGGASDQYLWITEQMICKKGVATRQRDYENCRAAAVDNQYRSFDQVVHEMAHSIDRNDEVRKKESAVYGSVSDAVEGFAQGAQRRFGATPNAAFTTLAREAAMARLFPNAMTFSCNGYTPGK